MMMKEYRSQRDKDQALIACRVYNLLFHLKLLLLQAK